MSATDILLVTAPFIQFNSPYPATTVLKGFLQKHNYKAEQLDLGIETIDALFSPKILKELFELAKLQRDSMPLEAQKVINNEEKYIETIEAVKSFLQGSNPMLAEKICNGLLPEGPNFIDIQVNNRFLKQLSQNDKAKYLSTLYLTDIGNLITDYIDPNFDFCRYAEHLHSEKATFSQIEESLKPNTIVTDIMWQMLSQKIESCKPKIVGFSIPFPGNLHPALKMGVNIKKHFPSIKIIIGGGYVSCELRSLKEPCLFNYTDFVCLDDGERPLLQILEHVIDNKPINELVRTFVLKDNKVEFINAPIFDFNHNETGIPDFSDLSLDKYMSTLSLINPMHRLWNDGRWNKMVLAHGCYWHRCSFCDITLDYIKRYSQADAAVLCDRIEAIMLQTGYNGFHFVDEAAPPVLLRNLALEILKRNLKISWWTNIRFDKLFTADLCQLLAHSGCKAVSGGLEVASDRLLQKMNKGVSLEQVSQVTANLQRAGIMVHAYLMYGFPTETEQETIDSLEVVRQLFSHGLINSGFWHLFVMTIHSEVGLNSEKFGVSRILPSTEVFSQNDCEHEDHTGAKHRKFGVGLRKALYNYMHGNCLENDLQEWFDFKIPKTNISYNLIENYLKSDSTFRIKYNGKIVWLGETPTIENGNKGKKIIQFNYNGNKFQTEQLLASEAEWLLQILIDSMPINNRLKSLADWESSYTEATADIFDLFLTSRSWNKLRNNGLLML